jgi:putative ABC transport system permease protein
VKTNPNIGVGGENLEGLTTNDFTVETGRGLTQQDLRLATSVVILGKTVAEKLFPPAYNPIGEKVRIDGSQYQVIGVFAAKGKGLGRNQDNFAVVPITTFMRTYGSTHRSVNIMVKALDREVFDDCVEQARSILRVARKVPPGEEDDFGYYSNDSLIKQFNDFTLYLRLGVLLVSSISLLAAGIGIMNIMLVSVTERTREIGIRKAVGARRRDILAQFIMEAIILCQIGGVIGVVFGILGGNVVGVLLEVSAVIPWDWAALGIGICCLVGLVFGVYPAWKAAALDPIEALRYE